MNNVIEPPRRLATRPKDGRGYPIPYTVLIGPDNTPHFQITDLKRWLIVVTERRCALCGEPLGRHVAFVGGPQSMMNRTFTDAGMHRECAEYALRVCPFLAAPNFKYAEKLRVAQAVRILSVVSTDRPSEFGLGVTTAYEVKRLGDSLVIEAAAFDELVWFKLGMWLGTGRLDTTVVCWD